MGNQDPYLKLFPDVLCPYSKISRGSEILMKQAGTVGMDKKLILLLPVMFMDRYLSGNSILPNRMSNSYSTVQTYSYRQISRIFLKV